MYKSIAADAPAPAAMFRTARFNPGEASDQRSSLRAKLLQLVVLQLAGHHAPAEPLHQSVDVGIGQIDPHAREQAHRYRGMQAPGAGAGVIGIHRGLEAGIRRRVADEPAQRAQVGMEDEFDIVGRKMLTFVGV